MTITLLRYHYPLISNYPYDIIVFILPMILINSAIQVQNELFASFADTRRQNWSIKFPSVESISLFCMHLTIAKSAIAGDQGIVTQDILPGSGTVGFLAHYTIA